MLPILPPQNRWIVRPRPDPQAQVRLFCFPYAGGSAFVFRTWPTDLPCPVEICAVQLPGRENRLNEPAFTRLVTLLPPLEQALKPYLDVPFAFFGHSMGALISFELARLLRRQNSATPIGLFVSACRAPHMARRNPPIHQLPDAPFMEELRRLNGTPVEVLQHDELMELVLPTLRADFAVYETYTYTAEEPLDCPILAFGGMQDTEVSLDELVAWREQSRRTFRLKMFDGDHFFLHQARSSILEVICHALVDGLPDECG